MSSKNTFLGTIFFLFFVLGNIKAQVDGALDNSFNIGTGFSNIVNSLALQADGKILVAGNFQSYNGQNRNSLVRINANGSLDNTFNIGSGFPLGSNTFRAIDIQPDGKILIGGYFLSYNGNARKNIVRINSDGSNDSSFGIGTGFNSGVHAIVIQPDGKILIGGSFTSYNGQTRNGIIRLNSNGSVDTSFAVGTGFNNSVYAITLQSDGKILVGGLFTSYNGQTRNRIVRLNVNGSLDSSFNIGTGADGGVYAITLQQDGKILTGGIFTSYDGMQANRILRLLTNGTKDPDFLIGMGFDDSSDIVNAILVQPNGKILIAGKFDSFSYYPNRKGLVRLYSTGGIDNSLNIGGGFTLGAGESNREVTSMTLQSDGKIIIGGLFTMYDGLAQNYLTRLHNQNGAVLNTEELKKSSMKVYPNPVKDVLYFDKKVDKISITDFTGKVLSTQKNVTQVNVSTFAKGVYLITIQNENGQIQTTKVIKE